MIRRLGVLRDDEVINIGRHQYGPLMYLVAFVISFLSVGLSVGVCLCLAVFFGFKGWPSRP